MTSCSVCQLQQSLPGGKFCGWCGREFVAAEVAASTVMAGEQSSRLDETGIEPVNNDSQSHLGMSFKSTKWLTSVGTLFVLVVGAMFSYMWFKPPQSVGGKEFEVTPVSVAQSSLHAATSPVRIRSDAPVQGESFQPTGGLIGELRIEKRPGQLRFSVKTQVNQFSCDIGGIAMLPANSRSAIYGPDAETCRIRFSLLPGDIVHVASEGCHSYCGMAAWFDGTYLKETFTGGGEGPSFDCAKARSEPEKIICATPELARSDREVSRIYLTARRFAVNSEEFRASNLRAWRRREETCRDLECLRTWYGKREADLIQYLLLSEQIRPL